MTAHVEAPFTIDSEEKAAWAVNKILSFDEQIERVKEQSKLLVESLEKEKASFEARFLLELEEWARANMPRKGKTVKLITGQLQFRRKPGGPRITDAAAFTDWARRHAQDLLTVETVYKPNRPAVWAHVTETGELFPGVEVLPEEELMYVKAKAVADADE